MGLLVKEKGNQCKRRRDVELNVIGGWQIDVGKWRCQKEGGAALAGNRCATLNPLQRGMAADALDVP